MLPDILASDMNLYVKLEPFRAYRFGPTAKFIAAGDLHGETCYVEPGEVFQRSGGSNLRTMGSGCLTTGYANCLHNKQNIVIYSIINVYMYTKKIT